jgi:hypothetical protein
MKRIVNKIINGIEVVSDKLAGILFKLIREENGK